MSSKESHDMTLKGWVSCVKNLRCGSTYLKVLDGEILALLD